MDNRQEPGLGSESANQPRKYNVMDGERHPPPNYVAWIVISVLGLIVAYVAITEYQIYRARQIITEAATTAQRYSQQATAQMNAQLSEQRERKAEAQRVQMQAEQAKRAGDSTGARLQRVCDEWTKMADGVKKSEYAIQEKKRTCNQLEAYVIHNTPPRP